MSGQRRNPGWVKSGDVANFLPAPIETTEREEEYWDGTLDYIHKAANYAASRIHFSGISKQEKRDLAFSEICMRIAEDPDITFVDMMHDAQRAIHREIDQLMSSHGTSKKERNTGARFATYWNQKTVHIDDYGLDRIALHQVWGAMREKDQLVILQRVAHPTNADVARATGENAGTVTVRYRNARKNALSLWFDFEAPPALKTNRQDTRTHCPHGHSLDQYAQWITDKDGYRHRRCGECNRLRQKAHRDKKKREP